MSHTTVGRWIAIVVLGATAGCAGPPATVLQQLMEVRRLTAELRVQFTKTADAANRAVMADTDDASATFAREAEQAAQMVQKDSDALGPLLASLSYADERGLFDQFKKRFADYRTLDRRILELAVLNTNLKAQRLSFGPAQQAADAFRQDLDRVAPLHSGDEWRVKALAASAVSNMREIQVLQAPHIAEPHDEAMADFDKRMAASEAAARQALRELASLIQPASRSTLAAATADLDRFHSVNAQIIDLSHQNSNVESLALSLGKKRTLTAACDDSLQALEEALAKRDFTATR